MPKITRIEVFKGIGVSTNEYCAVIFVDGSPDARIDVAPWRTKITHKSTLMSRIAGVDQLLMGVTLDRLLSHNAAVINPR
ncbi:hypothetical protein [Pseudomonas sp. ENNP23]|nr:hypothetical protein [Pseudomonas sp. ENNP23]OEC59464.1 hypothetical protein A9G05_11155 [Pseudomonas sp. ENNP23]